MTNQFNALTGLYYAQSILIDVRASDAGLVATMPGVPEGFETRVEPLGENQFRLIGGDVDGAVATFELGADGTAIALQVGPMVFGRVDSAENLHITQRVAAPEWQLSAEQQTAFDTLLATIDQHNGAWLDYDLPYPKYQFVQYVTTKDRYIFHGSNKQDIDEFIPVRQSVELNDESGRGNVQGIYGTHEALWAMFFAIVNRSELRGSIRNGVAYFHNAQGVTLPLFSFSINQEQLADRPYCDGALYFLPHSPFRRLPMWGDVMSNEWACEQRLRPLAKLRLTPDDFPFLGQIVGHDDGDLLRMQTLEGELKAAATAATLNGDRLTLWLTDTVDIDAYIELQNAFMPMIEYRVEETDTGQKVTASNLPPAMQQTMQKSFQALLST